MRVVFNGEPAEQAEARRFIAAVNDAFRRTHVKQ